MTPFPTPPERRPFYGHVPFHPSDHVRHRRPGGRHCDAPAPGPEAAPPVDHLCPVGGGVSSDDLSRGAVSAGEPGAPGHHQRGLCPAPPPRRARAGPGNGPRPRHARPGRAHPFRRRRDPTGPSRASGYSTARLAHRGVGRGGSGHPALGRSLLRQTPLAGGGGRAGGERGL